MSNDQPQWRTDDMCGRKVLVLDLKPPAQYYDENRDCSDCGKPAKQFICEIADDGTPDLSTVWMYCGYCEVG